MTEGDDTDAAGSDGTNAADETRSVGTDHKVLGRNESTDGTPVGVEGQVPNADGYGLATPTDAKVDGDLVLSSLAGGITGGDRVTDIAGSGLSITGGQLTVVGGGSTPAVPTLPPYDRVGDDPGAIREAMTAVFSESAWADPRFVTGPAHGEGQQAFEGGVVTPGGEVVLVPFDSDYVGAYEPTTNTYTRGMPHGKGEYAFAGGALAQTGEVVFAPNGSDSVGVYDPAKDVYYDGASTVGDGSFRGATLAPTGEVVLTPRGSDYVGVYDPVEGTYSRGPEVGDDSFLGGALAPTGDVVLPPADDSTDIGVYDPRTTTLTEVSHGEPGYLPFAGATTAPTGEVVLTPVSADHVGLYDPETGTYRQGASTGKFFIGAALAPTGEVVLGRTDSSDEVGIYDPVADALETIPLANDVLWPILAPDGSVVLVPSDADYVGVLRTRAKTIKSEVVAQHPLVNNS